MLVTPSVSTRTVMPATTVANHMKVLTREKAGRSNWIAFHQQPHSDSGRPRSNVAPPALALVRGPLLRTRDSQFVNHAGVHDRDRKRIRMLHVPRFPREIATCNRFAASTAT
jgi:hypothetical protein